MAPLVGSGSSLYMASVAALKQSSHDFCEMPVLLGLIILGTRDEPTFQKIGRTLDGLVGVRSDVRIEVQRGPVRPLWTAHAGTMDLYTRAKRFAAEIGFDLPHGQHGGGSDGNFTGAMGKPTLDGLGIMGAGAHTHGEHVLVSSIVPRTTMFARLVADLT